MYHNIYYYGLMIFRNNEKAWHIILPVKDIRLWYIVKYIIIYFIDGLRIFLESLLGSIGKHTGVRTLLKCQPFIRLWGRRTPPKIGYAHKIRLEQVLLLVVGGLFLSLTPYVWYSSISVKWYYSRTLLCFAVIFLVDVSIKIIIPALSLALTKHAVTFRFLTYTIYHLINDYRLFTHC